MSSIRAEMSGDTDALLQRLNKLKSLEKRGVLNSIAEGLRTSTVERFQSEKSPEGVGWTPSIRAKRVGRQDADRYDNIEDKYPLAGR